MKQDRDRVLKAAAAIANAIGMRRGVPPIVNILDLLPEDRRQEVIGDAEEALKAAGLAELLAKIRRYETALREIMALPGLAHDGDRAYQIAETVLKWNLDPEDARKKQPDTPRGTAAKRT